MEIDAARIRLNEGTEKAYIHTALYPLLETLKITDVTDDCNTYEMAWLLTTISQNRVFQHLFDHPGMKDFIEILHDVYKAFSNNKLYQYVHFAMMFTGKYLSGAAFHRNMSVVDTTMSGMTAIWNIEAKALGDPYLVYRTQDGSV